MALLGNVMAGALGYVPAKRIAPVVDEIFGVLFICTSDGATDAAHGGGSPLHNPNDHCPACVMLAQVALATAFLLLAVVAFPLPAAPRPVPIRSRRLLPHLSLGGIGSRAPPRFA